VQTIIDIDAQVWREAQEMAKRNGQPFSQLVEQALRESLRVAPPVSELFGEPFSEEDIDQSARVNFQALDEDERRSESR